MEEKIGERESKNVLRLVLLPPTRPILLDYYSVLLEGINLTTETVPQVPSHHIF